MQLAALSSLLLAWHRLPEELPSEKFCARALELLEAHLPMSSAWWGLAHMHGNSPRVVRGYLHRLPLAFADHWQAIADVDTLAYTVAEHPGVTMLYEADTRPGDFDERYGLAYALCTAIFDEDTGLGRFLSIYRDSSQPVFTEDDRALVELLVPHLFMAEKQLERQNWKKDIATKRAWCADVNEHAWLEHATPAFCRMLMREFPEWTGGRLPQALQELVRRGHGTWQGHVLDVSASRSTETTCSLTLEPRSAHGLTRREEMVARAYADGLSYKEIARELGLAPATVRGYLRECYIKLEVSNKVSLRGALTSSR
ncbi:LuxR C-terminal-related transcriptional regulator [Burkholderia sp. AU30198]|uniref:LuxR C-terminal-related transcriptional regulator n=1 Tax=Burkholderia sp. AU30198 TaxID=2879627 RepID=UPI001CF4D408|nr:LuxR C-terminal-related transcriptional regulator [Burkholderia sp. AU30198]MCA8295960.1 LuxR C-terminal-related transcriptional regulator [Burkholderia sp. AU30198]